MSKKVLLITRAYYPNNASGAHRPAKMAKYLPDFGWTPTVLCAEWTPENAGTRYDPILAAQPDVCRTVRIPYPATPPTRIGRAPRRVAEILFPYRAPLGFTRRMLAAAEELVGHERFDVIWSTYKPGMTHYVASRMARRHGIPWVADFRDLPDQYLKQTWADRRCVQCEIRICKHARVMVAVSQPQADVLVSRHGVPVYVIPNGYDPEDYPLESDVKFPKFNIGYFGSVYADRDSRALFMAIDRLASQSDVDLDDMLIQFYGAGEDCLSAMKAGFRCAGIVQCLPRVAHTEMIRLQQRCVILLVLSHKTSTGLMTAKIFDYMGARRPILDVPGGGVTGAVLEETRTGVGAESPKEIAKVLQRWYEEWKGTGTVAYRGIPGKIARYTRKEQAGQLAQIFDGLTMAR